MVALTSGCVLLGAGINPFLPRLLLSCIYVVVVVFHFQDLFFITSNRVLASDPTRHNPSLCPGGFIWWQEILVGAASFPLYVD